MAGPSKQAINLARRLFAVALSQTLCINYRFAWEQYAKGKEPDQKWIDIAEDMIAEQRRRRNARRKGKKKRP